MRKRRKAIEFEEGSGNIFADLGLEDAGELYTRAQIGVHVFKILKEKKLKQREIAGVLDVAGSVVISLPNLVHFVTRARIALGQFNYTSTGTLDHTHLRFFTIKTARELIQSAGYRITRFHPAVGGGRLSDRVRFALKLSARFAPGLFAYQMLFEAKNGTEQGS